MLSLLLVAVLSLMVLLAVGRALVGSVGERFAPGIVGAVARLVALAFAVRSAVVPSIVGGAIGAVAGPAVSLGMLAVCYARSRNAPAADEERLGRPFALWLPVALLDLGWVAVQLLIVWFLRDV